MATVYTRFRRYALDGVFTRALQQIQASALPDAEGPWMKSNEVRSGACTTESRGPFCRPGNPGDPAGVH